MLSEKEKLAKLIKLGVELNQVRDLDLLLERLLSDARNFVNADAGSIYIREGEKLFFTYTQNDTLQRLLPPSEKLIYHFFSLPIDEQSIAGYAASTGELLNIKDVYELDPDEPYSFSDQYDESSGYRTQSIITVPLKTAAGEILGILQIINAQDENSKTIPFTQADEDLMLHFASIAAVALERAQMTRAILLRMIRMSEMHDPKETGAHVNRVGCYAVELYEHWARRHALPEETIEREKDSLRMAAMLHDVGKVAISDIILKKPERFNQDEYAIMKQHTFLGARLFMDFKSDFDQAAYIVALNHHERWDGHGYPGHINAKTGLPLSGHVNANRNAMGKRGEEIPIFGRIVCLADVYDALSFKRVYKRAWSEAEVIAFIQKQSGRQFDPELVEIFLSRLNVIRSIRERYSEDKWDEDE